MEEMTIRVRSHTIHFYFSIETAGAEAKLNSFQRYFERMPDEHLGVIYPIFVIDQNPNGGQGGGTIMPSRTHNFKSERRSRLTGVPDEEIDRIVISRGLGLISIPRNRWMRPAGRLVSTVFHEVGHSVDYELGLAPSSDFSLNDVIGVRPTCGAGSAIKKYMIEAYARYIVSPTRICRDTGSTNQQAINALQSTRAFRTMTNGRL